MKYTSTLVVVRSMEESLQFYHDVLGLNVVNDFGANVTLDGGIVLQTLISWQTFINQRGVTFGGNNSELYFEEPDMDRFLNHLKQFKIEYVHPPMEHSWGQRVVRFYDPNHYMIEVGEEMAMVVKRFAGNGMTEEQIAKRMDVPLSYVQGCLRPESGIQTGG